VTRAYAGRRCPALSEEAPSLEGATQQARTPFQQTRERSKAAGQVVTDSGRGPTPRPSYAYLSGQPKLHSSAPRRLPIVLALSGNRDKEFERR